MIKEEKEKLKKIAKTIREEIIKMISEAGSGHTAGSLDMVEILVAIYFNILKYDPKNPDWKDRDYLIYSHGHTCPALYAVMAEVGFFPKSELRTLRKLGSPLQGHPHKEWLKGLETSSGPLGEGLSQAIGMALAHRINVNFQNSDDKYFYCLMSDGEFQEGQTWEALMLAGKEKLNKLIAIVDRNNIQISGNTEDVMPLESFKNKLESFNWSVMEIDGHNFEEIIGAIEDAKKVLDKPIIIIANTIAGKGFKEFEGDYRWHGKVPTPEQAKEILNDSIGK
ncbi:MAG: transketolase [Candidatus Pacebacteria bacterium]|nr:transketolase [Candidatus Paceibacterota bacterium]